MAKSPAAEAIEILLGASIIGAPNASWPGFVGLTQATPDAQVGIVDTPGQTPNPKWLLDYPTIQVTVRGAINGYQAAWDKALAIKNKLLGTDPITTLTDSRWDGVTMMGDVHFIGNDQNSRPLIVGNYRIIREPVSTPGVAREALPS